MLFAFLGSLVGILVDVVCRDLGLVLLVGLAAFIFVALPVARWRNDHLAKAKLIS